MANSLTEIKVVADEEEYSFSGGMREVHGTITNTDTTITLEEGWKIVKYYLYIRGNGMDSCEVSVQCQTGRICQDLVGGSDNFVVKSTVDTSTKEKTTRGCCLNWDAKNLIIHKTSGTIRELTFEYWVYY